MPWKLRCGTYVRSARNLQIEVVRHFTTCNKFFCGKFRRRKCGARKDSGCVRRRPAPSTALLKSLFDANQTLMQGSLACQLTAPGVALTPCPCLALFAGNTSLGESIKGQFLEILKAEIALKKAAYPLNGSFFHFNSYVKNY